MRQEEMRRRKSTAVKLCGIRRMEEVVALNALYPEYVGFVFYKKSRRYVTYEQAKELRERLNPLIQTVGVFVREKEENIQKLYADGIIQLAQIHGGEDEGCVRRLKDVGVPVIRVFQIENGRIPSEAYTTSADYVMFDPGMGDGESFDWSPILHFPRAYFLAGGLDEGNVAAAIASCHPYAVDVSSGIETDGMKDDRKMQRFVAAARGGYR